MVEFHQLLPILIALNIFSTCNALGDIPRPRGVSISRASLYEPRDTFTCLDGRRTIKYTQVNDDYCDCDDGSDEPGTAACPNGSFYCSNTGHKPKSIPSSWVNDGVCDCCDASDEYDGVAGKCSNNCNELGKEDRMREKQRAELAKRGNQLRAEMILRGKALKEENTNKLGELIKSKAEAEAVKQEKEKIKHLAEDLEKAALETYRAAAEEEKRARDEEQAQANQKEAEETFRKYDSNQNGKVEVVELQTRIVFDRNRDGEVSVEEAKYFLESEEQMDLDTFVTVAWPKIKPFLMMDSGLFRPPRTTGDQGGEAGDMEPSASHEAREHYEDEEEDDVGVGEIEQVDDNEGVDDDQHEDEEGEDDGGEYDQNQHDNQPEDQTEPPPIVEYDAETQQLIHTANAARNDFNVADRELREIDTQLNEIKGTVEKDLGPEEEYAALVGECFNYEDREYVYKLCPFDKASQQPRSGGSETRLGNWDAWKGTPPNIYSKMMYANGSGCWNGPQRSALVVVECGLDNKLVAVSEPNRCEYEFKFETPAACTLEAMEKTEEHGKKHDEL